MQKLLLTRGLQELIILFTARELKTKFADAKVLCFLVKRWLQELKDDMEEQLQAHFIFKRHLVGSLKQISCNLCSSYNHMIDGFTPCQVFYILIGCLNSESCPFLNDVCCLRTMPALQLSYAY